jgi:hypothetical protein
MLSRSTERSSLPGAQVLCARMSAQTADAILGVGEVRLTRTSTPTETACHYTALNRPAADLAVFYYDPARLPESPGAYYERLRSSPVVLGETISVGSGRRAFCSQYPSTSHELAVLHGRALTVINAPTCAQAVAVATSIRA